MQVPYGVVHSSPEGRLISIVEKPVLPFSISAGINVFSPEALSSIPSNTFFDIPDFFREILAREMPVYVHEINEYWLDIGHPDDYTRADRDARMFFL